MFSIVFYSENHPTSVLDTPAVPVHMPPPPPLSTAPSAGNDLGEYFRDSSAMDLAALHPLMAQLLCQLRQAPMPPVLQHLLPDVGVELWSAVEEGLQAGIPVPLKALRRHANNALREATASESSSVGARLHPWHDAEGFVTSYRAIINSPECPVPSSTTIPVPKIHHPFPLPEW